MILIIFEYDNTFPIKTLFSTGSFFCVVVQYMGVFGGVWGFHEWLV